jgi:hypothetical protein
MPTLYVDCWSMLLQVRVLYLLLQGYCRAAVPHLGIDPRKITNVAQATAWLTAAKINTAHL